jgi:hypothetical protein
MAHAPMLRCWCMQEELTIALKAVMGGYRGQFKRYTLCWIVFQTDGPMVRQRSERDHEGL